ncbi:epidermal differentiation-specific protein-like [Protopterus annectens]|uniref:epidermal differentiation-specific protein-like n=1 Tax=Protopterus annectens TaxID=7888 RepID=UPI001CFA4B5B|nr:epidermal differentiation-specific protein-like [Protopterus annectens]
MSKIIVYEHPDFKGLYREFTDSVPNLLLENFNDCISSLKVIGQPWVSYEHPNFTGWAQVFEEGNYSWIDCQDSISSFKLITEDLEHPEITIYEHPNYAGRSRVFKEEADLTKGDFNDIASSHIVQRGAWALYEHPNRGGWFWLARAGERAPDYGTGGFHDKVSHVYPLKAGAPVIKAVLQWDKLKTGNTSVKKIDQFVGVNRTDFEKTYTTTLTKEYETSTTETFTFKNETSISVGTKFSLNVNAGIASAGVESSFNVSNTFTVEKGKTESVTNRKKIEVNLPCTIPPHTKQITYIMEKIESFTVPVELTITSGSTTKTEYGEYRCEGGTSIDYEFALEKLPKIS